MAVASNIEEHEWIYVGVRTRSAMSSFAINTIFFRIQYIVVGEKS